MVMMYFSFMYVVNCVCLCVVFMGVCTHICVHLLPMLVEARGRYDILGRITIAVMKHCDQKQLEERIYLSYTST